MTAPFVSREWHEAEVAKWRGALADLDAAMGDIGHTLLSTIQVLDDCCGDRVECLLRDDPRAKGALSHGAEAHRRAKALLAQQGGDDE